MNTSIPVANTLAIGSADAVIATGMTPARCCYAWSGESPGISFNCSGRITVSTLRTTATRPRFTGIVTEPQRHYF